MSMLSAGLKKLRKGLHLPPVTLKNVATKYAPVALGAGALAGVGPLAGIASKVGSIASKIPGAGVLKNTLHMGGFGGGDVNLDPETGLEVQGGGGGSGLLGQIGGYLKNTLGGALKTAADNPLETIGGLAAAKAGTDSFNRANDLSKKAVALREQSYNERAPLRKLGLEGLQKPTALPPQEFVNTANPFAKKKAAS